ncbi:MAG: DNA/RNA nuclease SfsA [Proteobacteria bacterium]|nr:DNA/RNA nuclease SfsA [Pseudomonadota bacterium]
MLHFSQSLHRAQFKKRYKRFFVDAVLEDGSTVTAHCPNTGSMKSCFTDNGLVLLSSNNDPKRKLKYTLELIGTDGGYIGANTSRPNYIVEDAIRRGAIKELQHYKTLQKEVKYGDNSRIDILLSQGQKPECYVEVKNATMIENGIIQFPDAVTERGQKHLIELQKVVQAGLRGVIFFLVNRPEGEVFSPADHIDPKYGKLLREAAINGVEILAYRCKNSPEGSVVSGKIKVEL